MSLLETKSWPSKCEVIIPEIHQQGVAPWLLSVSLAVNDCAVQSSWPYWFLAGSVSVAVQGNYNNKDTDTISVLHSMFPNTSGPYF